MNLYMVKFVPYTGHGEAAAVFKTEKAAAKEYRRAQAVQNEWLETAEPNAIPIIPFDITDDFGISYSLNLANHLVCFTSFDDSAKMNAETQTATEVCQNKYGRTTAGYLHQDP